MPHRHMWLRKQLATGRERRRDVLMSQILAPCLNFPAIFGRGGYAIMNDAARLPTALPAIYRKLVAS